MTSRTIERDGIHVKINSRNQLVVDMSIEQMNALYLKHRGRMPANRTEAEDFINTMVFKKLIQNGIIKK